MKTETFIALLWVLSLFLLGFFAKTKAYQVDIEKQHEINTHAYDPRAI